VVSRGFVPADKPIPAPDMSFVRLFNDNSVGWQHRGQYAIWTGASAEGGPRYRLLERIGNRVVAIEHQDGSPVLHKIAAGVAFTVENLMGFWLALDSDAMWLDTACSTGRYAALAIGGAAGKPGQAVVDWTCPRCGTPIHPQTFDIPRLAFQSFLRQADATTATFDADLQLRACGGCGSVHPLAATLIPNEIQLPQGGGS
jgi:hypothetical protein